MRDFTYDFPSSSSSSSTFAPSSSPPRTASSPPRPKRYTVRAGRDAARRYTPPADSFSSTSSYSSASSSSTSSSYASSSATATQPRTRRPSSPMSIRRPTWESHYGDAYALDEEDCDDDYDAVPVRQFDPSLYELNHPPLPKPRYTLSTPSYTHMTSPPTTTTYIPPSPSSVTSSLSNSRSPPIAPHSYSPRAQSVLASASSPFDDPQPSPTRLLHKRRSTHHSPSSAHFELPSSPRSAFSTSHQPPSSSSHFDDEREEGEGRIRREEEEEDNEKDDNRNSTPTCSQGLKMQWAALVLGVRFKVFRARKKLRRTA